MNTIKDFEELISKPEYRFKMPENVYKRKFELCNHWTDPKIFDLWDNLTEKNGRIPTPEEYIEEGFEITRKHWFKRSVVGAYNTIIYTKGKKEAITLYWTEDKQKAIRWRLGKMYASFIAEESALISVAEVFPDSLVLTSKELDIVAGIDVAVVDRNRNKSIYIHVAKDNQWTEANIKTKAGKRMWLRDKNGRKQYHQRQWNSAHTVFGYTDYESNSTKNINGHLVFRKEYIEQQGLNAMNNSSQTFLNNELVSFDNWLREKYIDEEGVCSMITYKFGELVV